MLLCLPCNSFADGFYPFDPIEIESYKTDTSMPEIINSFFAPIKGAEENTPTVSTESPFKEITHTKQQTPNMPSINIASGIPQFEENPFEAMHTITLPSEYKSMNKLKNLPQNIETENGLKDPPTEVTDDSSYVSSAIEETQPMTDFEGKTISRVNFKGLFYVKENTLKDIIKTGKGAVFNTELIQNDLGNIYSLGYFTDSMYVEPELKKDGTVELTFVLEENITIKNIELKGNTVCTTKELGELVKNLEGMPENLKLINEDIGKINKYYADKGYILAKVVNVEDNADGKLVFVISEGIIEEINIEGNEKTKDYIIKRNILTQPGSVYNEEIIKKDLSKVYATKIFDKVDREIKPSLDKDGEYIVTVKVTEGSSNNVSIGLGIDSALGGFGSVSYNEKNLFGRNQKLSLSGMLGSGLLMSDASIKNRMNWNLELNFFEPHFINENNTFGSKLYYRDLGSYQVPLAIERRWGWNNTLEHKVRGYDNLTTSLALGFENIHLKEGDLNKISALYRQNNIDFSRRKEQLEGGMFINIAPGVKYSTLDDEGMPREGIIAQANFVESLSLSNSKHTSGRVIGGLTKYIPIAKKSTLLIGAKGGVKVHGNDMPEVMSFKLGGPYTIRGFRMNGVGSGDSFVMASAELQTPVPFMDKLKYDFFKNLRLAFFIDAGKVFDPTITSTLYDRPLSAISGGVGLRINIPGMTTISVDYGIPMTHTGKYGPKHGYFTFGTGGLYDSY